MSSRDAQYVIRHLLELESPARNFHLLVLKWILRDEFLFLALKRLLRDELQPE
jgi:hypothetical protein